MAVDIERIKASTPLLSTIEKLTGEQVVKHKICCPFHNDMTPSLHIFDDGKWKCFGCGKHGDVLDFLGYYYYGLRYDPAIHFVELIDRLGALEIKPLPQRTIKPKPEKPKLNISLEQVYRWHETMSEERREYWYSRKLTDQTINEFFLGWDGKRFTIPALYRLIPFAVKRRKFDVEDGIDAKYTSIEGSRVGLFNADNLAIAHTVIICEGEIDCMLLHQNGFTAVSSTGGAGSWKADWSQFFSHVANVFVIYDNDKAGVEGALKIKQSIRRAKIVTLPDGINDIGDMYAKMQNANEWLAWAVK